MKKTILTALIVCLLFSLCSCGKTEANDDKKCSLHEIEHQAVFNRNLSDSYYLSDEKALPVDEKTYSYYDLSSLPDAELLTDNWLVCEDGSVYRLDVGEYFRNDYCNSLYQLYWDELSADSRLELYATDTLLKTETGSGRILCSVENGNIQGYMFLENADYSQYLELIEMGGELYTCNFYPQIGELHLVKTVPFENNESIINKISKEDGILFIRHQILPVEGYWSMTGIYVFTQNGKLHTVYNGEIVETSEDIFDISFKYGNSAVVKKDMTVFSERTEHGKDWKNVVKVVVSEYLHNMIGLTCDGEILCCDSNVYQSELSEWKNVKDIALLYYNEAFYPIALTIDGSFLLTSDNPFYDQLSSVSSVLEFRVRERETESFAVAVLYENGELELFK